MDGSLEQRLRDLAALDAEGLGRLVRAKALQAMSLHFMLRGMKEQFSAVAGDAVNDSHVGSLDQLWQSRAG